MREDSSQVRVEAWVEGGLLLERYRYSAGWSEPLPAHAHPEYQFALCVDRPGSYCYRGSRYALPVGALAVLHSGEPHQTGEDRRRLLPPASHLMMYAGPAVMLAYGGEVSDRPARAAPYFPQVLLEGDKDLLRAYAELFRARGRGRARLERDAADLAFFTRLVARHARGRAQATPFRAARPAVARAVEYLHAVFAEDVSLEELARVAGVSRFYLVRAFRREIGLPPHKYLISLRVSHAKRLLLGGASVARAAAQTGFYDESHFGKYFKRIVGVSPGSYPGGNVKSRAKEASS